MPGDRMRQRLSAVPALLREDTGKARFKNQNAGTETGIRSKSGIQLGNTLNAFLPG